MVEFQLAALVSGSCHVDHAGSLTHCQSLLGHLHL